MAFVHASDNMSDVAGKAGMTWRTKAFQRRLTERHCFSLGSSASEEVCPMDNCIQWGINGMRVPPSSDLNKPSDPEMLTKKS